MIRRERALIATERKEKQKAMSVSRINGIFIIVDREKRNKRRRTGMRVRK
jgi:hypothetical protein